MKDLFVIPAVLESYRTLKDRTFKITFETNEVSPSKAGQLQSNLLLPGYLAFKGDPFKKEEINELENIESDFDDIKKSPSKRLRGVLFILFKQDAEDFETFERYYEYKLEKIITHYKEKIED